MIQYKCPFCKTELETEEALSGAQDTCPECGRIHPVPLSKQDLTRARKEQKAEQKRARKEQKAARAAAWEAAMVAAVEAQRARKQQERLNQPSNTTTLESRSNNA